MCGIFGYSTHNKAIDQIFFDSLKHRGPDSQGVVSVGAWTLGHLRLSIIDTSSTGTQPMEKNGNWIVFNGEIYNYLELKEKYLKNTYLTGSSDTEVLLALLIKYGVKIVHELNGMFSFAFYNKKTKELLLCRDRFGVKPLYWTQVSGVFYFASETKPLVKMLGSAVLNPAIVASYMTETVTDHLDESYIQNIFQILPGQYATLSEKSIKTHRWYRGKDYSFNKKIFLDKRKTLDHFEDLLTDAILLRYRSDVPVCLTLSGGLDSSVIYILTKERLKKNIHPIIFQNKGSRIDELPIASKLVQAYNDTVSIVSSKMNYTAADLLNLTRILEFPIWNPSALAYKAIYAAIRKKGFKVVIEGHGSDEQLGGYPYMVEEIWKERAQSGKILSAYTAYKAFQSTLNQDLDQEKSQWAFPILLIKVLLQKFKVRHNAKKLIYKSFDRNILPIVLRAFDRLSMAESLESRCPFMDFRVVEFIRAMPSDYLVDELGSKAPLRHILKKYKKDFVYKDRPKVGFAIDIKQLFTQPKTRSVLIDYVNKFNDRRFLREKVAAQKIIHSLDTSWPAATEVWKVSAVAMTQELYEK